MANFRFSLEKVRKFQKQKQRLADLETIRCKTELDESLAMLDDLRFRFREAANALDENLREDGRMTMPLRELLGHLECRIELAGTSVKENELAWEKSAAASVAEKVRSESFEALMDSELAVRKAEIEKSESTELAELVMRQWTTTKGESVDG